MRKGEWRGAKTRWAMENARKRATMLRVSPPTSVKPVNNLICCKTGLIWVIKRTTTLFNSFCGNVTWQDKLHVSCCPFVRPLKGARAILPKKILVWLNMCQRRSFWQDVASTEWPLYIRGPNTNCRWEKEWASLLSLMQRSGLRNGPTATYEHVGMQKRC